MDLWQSKRKCIFMKRFTKLFNLILTIVLIVSIFPAATTNAAEKKYKLSLTGKYDLDDWTKAMYQYEKTLKGVKLEKVAGKNQWNLTMYADTAADLPVNVSATTSKVEITTKSEYVDGEYDKRKGVITVYAEDKGQKKTLTNKVLTCKSYNKSGKCLSTLKIVVKILPANAKMKRKVPATGKELYELGYERERYSDFAWEYVIKKFPEYLLPTWSSLYEDSAEVLSEEMKHTVYEVIGEVFSQEKDADGLRYYRPVYEVSREECNEVQAILDSLELNQYETDWEKVLAVQKWVKKNIEYDWVEDVSVHETLRTGYTMCSGYANLMNTACRLLGIPCYIVEDPNYMGEGHAWNIVLVDGLWCTMDLTGRPCFGYVPTEGFKVESTLAVESVQKVFDGEIYREDSSKYWDSIEECWEEDTEE